MNDVICLSPKRESEQNTEGQRVEENKKDKRSKENRKSERSRKSYCENKLSSII